MPAPQSPPAPTSPAPIKLAPPRFQFPFRKKDGTSKEFTNERDLYFLLAEYEGGAYLASPGGIWHGGIHITEAGAGRKVDTESGIRCIADGQVIAYRLDRNYPISRVRFSDDEPVTDSPYSTSFVLVRHVMEFPRDSWLTFYSLYMHLRAFSKYSDDASGWPTYWPICFEITMHASDRPDNGSAGQAAPPGHIGLRVRTGPASGSVPVAILPRGAQVRIGKRDKKWGQIVEAEGVQPYPPKAGGYASNTDLIGKWIYLGKNTAGQLEARKSLPDTAFDQVVVLPEPHKINAGDPIGHLGRYDSLNRRTSDRMVHIEVFCGDDIKPFLQQGRDWIDDHSFNPNDWKQLGLPSDPTVLRVGKGSKLYKAPLQEGQDAPRTDVTLVRTFAELAKHPENRRAETETEGQASCDHRKRNWWKVDGANMLRQEISGWVREECFVGGRATREFAQSWIDFETFEDEHDPAHTMFASTQAYIDYATGADVPNRASLDKLSPLMAKVYRAVFTTGDGEYAADQLRFGGRSIPGRYPWDMERMSRLIVKHESEWANPGKWRQLIEAMEERTQPKPHHEEELKRIEKLAWWEEVKKGVPDLPGPAVFHIHPVALVGNFSLPRKNLADLIQKIGDIISSGEGNYESYNSGTKNVPNGAVGYSFMSSPAGTVTNKTINQIIATDSLSGTNPNRFFATGKYQTIISTLRSAKESMGLTGDEKYDAAMQERVFRDYLLDKAGGGVLSKFVKKGEGTVDDAQYAASKEWASIAVPTGRPIKNGQISNGTLSYYSSSANSAFMGPTNKLRAILELISSEGI